MRCQANGSAGRSWCTVQQEIQYMVQQSLNYSSEHYFYSLFELIHRVSESCCQILVISSHWICKSCGRGLVQSVSFYGTKEDNRVSLKHKRFDSTQKSRARVMHIVTKATEGCHTSYKTKSIRSFVHLPPPTLETHWITDPYKL